MFSITSKNTAKKKIKQGLNVYLTSDSSIYVVNKDKNIDYLKEHCIEHDLQLMSMENEQIIDLGTPNKKIKK